MLYIEYSAILEIQHTNRIIYYCVLIYYVLILSEWTTTITVIDIFKYSYIIIPRIMYVGVHVFIPTFPKCDINYLCKYRYIIT